MQKLEAMLIVMDGKEMLLVSGTGEVITPDEEGVLAIGSGGNYALAAARSMLKYGNKEMTAEEIAKGALNIAADICIFTNHNIIVETI